MPFARGPGRTRIHYEIQGDGKRTAVLLQGLGLSSRFWFDQPRRLTTASEPWRVVTIDNRGVGRSDRPHGPYTMATLADDVLAVLEHAHIPRAYVVGLSLGGMIAQHVALRHPARTAGLVLLGTSAGFPHMRLPSPRDLASFLSLPFDGRLEERHVPGSLARLLLSARDLPRHRELLADWPAAFQTNPPPARVYMSHFAALMSHSTGFRLRAVKCPAVVVTGDDDTLLPHHNSRLLARLLPGAHLEVIPGAGHIVPVSDPECISRSLERVRAMVEGRMTRTTPTGMRTSTATGFSTPTATVAPTSTAPAPPAATTPHHRSASTSSPPPR
jgi:pimeloyl-ACP methyl ester carboxylesterase